MIMIFRCTSLLLLASILFINVRAQGVRAQRIVYDLTFQKDTNDAGSKIKDQYALDIFDTHSKFVSFTKLKGDAYIDSLSKAIEAQGGIQNVKSINISKSNMGSGASYEVYKFSDGKIKFQQRLQRNNFGYEEDMSGLSWNVTDTIEKYGQYNCQLAKTSYGGRNWNALFTTEIPVNNGPYKFSGLPGLIVKMWDDKEQCLFELAEVKNITDGNAKIPIAEIIKKSEFKKMEENARVTLLGMVSGITNPGGGAVVVGSIRDHSGNEISQEEIQRRRADAERKNNNRLELL